MKRLFSISGLIATALLGSVALTSGCHEHYGRIYDDHAVFVQRGYRPYGYHGGHHRDYSYRPYYDDHHGHHRHGHHDHD